MKTEKWASDQDNNAANNIELSEGHAFVIADWEESFENAQTRRTKHLNSVLMPLRGQSNMHRRILAFKNGYKALAIWHLLIQLAAECPQRGILVRSTGVLDIEELTIELGIPKEDLQEALAILMSPKVQWIKTINCPQNILVSGSLRRGRKYKIAPQTVPVSNQKTGPTFHIDGIYIAKAVFSANGAAFVPQRVYLKDFKDTYEMYDGYNKERAARKEAESVLEHKTNTSGNNQYPNLEGALKQMQQGTLNRAKTS